MAMIDTTNTLVRTLRRLRTPSSVSVIYNPLVYARKPHDMYLQKYGKGPKDVVLVGMNPGPWGMAQTGVPFGEVGAVRDWMGIEAPVSGPKTMHPKRPVDGFACARSEVSGRRLWGWAKEVFGTPKLFFDRFFVVNYCPLIFYDEQAKNITPDKLPRSYTESLFDACDRALRETVVDLEPKFVVGVGVFAFQRAEKALDGMGLTIGRITHPSPANPHANKNWAGRVSVELASLGIRCG